MKKNSFLFILLALLIFTSNFLVGSDRPVFELSSDIHKNDDLPFVSHHGQGRFQSYVTMEVQFEPMAELFRQLLVYKHSQLTSRGEAHVTVITPIEYFDVLREYVGIEEIDEIALNSRIQESHFEIQCLGRGIAAINGKQESTYYVVVTSNDLIQIRKKVLNLFVSRGGNKDVFDPQKFFPHITLGFSARDLHESDGVVKDTDSCFADIIEIQ